MKTDNVSIANVLSENRRFMVPLYQRQYQWIDDRLAPFWEDVEAKASEVLDESSRFQHYMGALILAPLEEGSSIGLTPKIQIVDGQQRLTTFQIFLASLREVARDYDCHSIVNQIEGYLFNQLRPKDTDQIARFKLTPTPMDRKVFHDLIEKEHSEIQDEYCNFYRGNKIPKNTRYKALRAYDFFIKLIAGFVANGPSERESDSDDEADSQGNGTGLGHFEERLHALLQAVLERMKLIVITLGEDDDAQVIFETLNSKGKPLLAMDLVRNNIFHRARGDTDAIEELYNEKWSSFDEFWWTGDAPNARPKRPRIDHFLAHVLTAETGQKISMRELYAEYRAFAAPKGKPRFPNVEDELEALRKHAPIYETLEDRKDVNANPVMAWLGRKLTAWQVTTAYPIALQIAAASLSEEEQERIAKSIYSYIVRRAICGLTSKNLNNVFRSIAQSFLRSNPSFLVLQKFFHDRPGDSTRFPTNEEFRNGVLSNPVSAMIQEDRIRDILWEFELAIRAEHGELPKRPSLFWMDHVMPEFWDENWPFETGGFVQPYAFDPRAESRVHLARSLGNLTLLASGSSALSGDMDFQQKREAYAEDDSLFLNRWFEKKETWYESDIRERGEDLAEKAIDIWPNIEK